MAPVTKPAKPQSPSFLRGMKESTLYIVISVLIVLASIGGYILGKSTVTVPSIPVAQACTMEAKICPDGTAVGRSGPSCEFSPCPPETGEQSEGQTGMSADSGEYSKRLFDPTGTVIETAPFPQEMTEVTDSALVGLQCSGYYYKDGNGKFLMESESGSKELTDGQLLDVASKHPTISAISSCKTDTGVSIVHYEIEAGAAGAGNIAYFYTMEEDGTLKQVADIPNDGAPYFGCRFPYMATRGNMWYWGCGGGDGGFGQATIYAINIAKDSVRRILKCTSTADSDSADPGGPTAVKCE